MELVEKILDLFFPRRCIFCHRLMREEGTVCSDCAASLPETGTEAVQRLKEIDRCCSPLYYEGDVRSSLLRYKFGGQKMYAKVYGEFLSRSIDENGFFCDSITWAPLSRQRLRKRGYDQARLLAEELARKKGIPCIQLLRKTRNNRAQSSTESAEERRKNVHGVYEAMPGAPIAGRDILLVDDIVTTGSTLSECARVLKAAGAASVSAVTVARKRI